MATRYALPMFAVGLCALLACHNSASLDTAADYAEDDDEAALTDAQNNASLALTRPPAKLTLHPLLGSHMVLQRLDSQLSLFGYAPVGTTVSVSWDGATPATATASGNLGAWSVPLGSMQAGGPHTVTVTSTAGNATLTDVMVGDVWLIGGQSNASRNFDYLSSPQHNYSPYWVSQAQNAVSHACSTTSSTVRYARVSMASATKPLTLPPLALGWSNCDRAIAAISAEGFVMGNDLQSQLNVPIGIVQNAYGGTVIKSWIANQSGHSGGRANNSATYNAMLAPLVGMRFAGVSWYQGETDSHGTSTDTYAAWLTTLLSDWRSQLASPDLPFLIIQTAGYAIGGDAAGRDGPAIRAAQARVADADAKSALVVTLDIGDASNIHPPNKYDVGHRAAGAALRLVYDATSSAYVTPTPSVAELQPDRSVLIRFTGLGSGMKLARKVNRAAPVTLGSGTDIGSLEAFVGGQTWFPAQGSLINGGTAIRVSVPGQTGKINAVRYNFYNFPDPMGRLYGDNNLPVGPFYRVVPNN